MKSSKKGKRYRLFCNLAKQNSSILRWTQFGYTAWNRVLFVVSICLIMGVNYVYWLCDWLYSFLYLVVIVIYIFTPPWEKNIQKIFTQIILRSIGAGSLFFFENPKNLGFFFFFFSRILAPPGIAGASLGLSQTTRHCHQLIKPAISSQRLHLSLSRLGP